MQSHIGQVAGKVWRSLGDKGTSTIPQISKAVNEPVEVVTLGLGWLARENKIVLNKGTGKKPEITASLTSEEKKVYEGSARKSAPALAR
jgi:hypothetical protein